MTKPYWSGLGVPEDGRYSEKILDASMIGNDNGITEQVLGGAKLMV